jgi:hypothetical protein
VLEEVEVVVLVDRLEAEPELELEEAKPTRIAASSERERETAKPELELVLEEVEVVVLVDRLEAEPELELEEAEAVPPPRTTELETYRRSSTPIRALMAIRSRSSRSEGRLKTLVVLSLATRS